MLPKEIRIIENRHWRVVRADLFGGGDFPGLGNASGWYWIVCIEKRNDVRRISIAGWSEYPIA